MSEPTFDLLSAASSVIERIGRAAVGVWRLELFGWEVGQVIVAALILAVSILFRGALARVLLVLSHRLAARTVTKLDDKVLTALDGPLKLIPVIIGVFVAVRVVGLHETAPAATEQIELSFVAVAVFWAMRNAVEPLAYLADPLRRALSSALVDWLMSALKIMFVFLGAAAVLEIWGVPVGPIIAGLGIFGVAVALGAQDLFKNLIAGISIMLERRFERGDWILVDGVVEGTVERIGFRSTIVRRFDKSPVYVPNAPLADNPVTNFTRMTHRRIFWKIGLEYGSTAAQLEAVQTGIRTYLENHAAFAKPPEAQLLVYIDSFNASSIDIMVYCFTYTTVWAEWLALKQELALAIKRIVEDNAGAAFAFPSQTIYFADGAAPGVGLPPER